MDQNKNFESDTIGFLISDGFRISKMSDSIVFGICHIPTYVARKMYVYL